MIDASDAILSHIGEIQDPDAAIALAHMKVIRESLSTDRITWELLTREIIIARRAAIATNDEGGLQTLRTGNHPSANVPASGGEADAPPTTSTDFSP